MNTPGQQLSESLLAACKAAGIEKPKYIAQDKSGFVFHYNVKPNRISSEWLFGSDCDFLEITHPPYAEDWKESLLEWVEPQEMLPTVFIPHEGEPLTDVLARHPEHVADDTEMVILYNLADTSKKVDDAIRIGYHKHVVNGDGLCWSRAGDYRAGWEDALAWKGGSHE
jgi:hypothetical protein